MTIQSLKVTVTLHNNEQWPETWTLYDDGILIEYLDGSDYGYSMNNPGLSELVQQILNQSVVDNPPFFTGVHQLRVEQRKIDGEWKGVLQ